ncbi:MAG: LLM class flavin-dependent oxidoreductase [Gammaproteobacteria bacterium]|nr:LLM class flavin-dependent oxidoreductase [Gammaproteobacteria bacterium]
MTGLHLGLTPWIVSGMADAATLARQGELAESWGYQSFWLPENHFGGEGAIPEPLMLLAAVAARTRTLRLATTSYLLPLRNPLQAAEQVAVLDRLSGGRVTLGVGRGYSAQLLGAFSVAPKDKRRIFEWCLEHMIRAWRGEPVALSEGAEPVTVAPLPVQRPHPPIWVAAFGPKALAQAGSLGAPYLASPMEPLERLRDNYRRHVEACEAAGQPVPPEVPLMRSCFVSADARLVARVRDGLEAQARRMAAESDGRMARRFSTAVDDWALVGEPGAVRDRVDMYREELGMTHLVVTRLRINVDAATAERSVETMARLLS